MNKLEVFNKISNEIYPLTIIHDRYGGTYSDGEFTAWPYEHWDIDENVDADDVSCMTYWHNTEDIAGRGNTIIDAVVDLGKRMKEKYNRFADIDFDTMEDTKKAANEAV